MGSLVVENEMSKEYIVWKQETLANQTGHLEERQASGLWKKFNNYVAPLRQRDTNNYVLEVAPGHRLSKEGDIEAIWSCPKWQELGCPATFSTRLESFTEPNFDQMDESMLMLTTHKMEPNKCLSTHHCCGCKEYNINAS